MNGRYWLQHRELGIVISYERLSKWAGMMFSIQFVGVIIAADFFEILDVQWSDVVTGIILYISTIIALCLLIPNVIQTKQGYRIYLCLCMLICLTFIWFFVDSLNASNIAVQTAYDLKRPYFFLQGVTLAGLVGLFAATNWRSFALSFMKWTLAAGVLACGLYLSTYHLDVNTGRFAGATALQHAIVFSAGVSCAFAFLFLAAKGLFRSRLFTVPVLWASIVFLTTGILVSGTRAAFLGAIVSGLVYVFLTSRRGKLRRMIMVVSGLVVISAITIQWVPYDSMDRVTQIEEGGLDQRTRLIDLAFISFEHHPFGKTREYKQALDGQNYAHDTLLQMLLEVGIVGAPVLLIIIILAVENALKYFRSDPLISGFMIVLLYLILQSFSSGTAYDPQFWFSVVFLAALTRRTLIKNRPQALELEKKSGYM